MGDESEHSERSPSGGSWWGNCYGAPDYCKKLGLKSVSGPAAVWGSTTHGHGEHASNYILGRRKDPPKMPPDDKEMKEVVEFYTNALFCPNEELFEPNERLCDCPMKEVIVGVEEKGKSPHLPHSGGTMDFVANCEKHGWLRVSDLKTGYNEVEARDNIQCIIYALHAFLSGKYKVNRVVLEIIQPRAPSGIKVKRWGLTALELLEWLPVVQRKVRASMAPDAPLIAGKVQCKYCPAATVCPERRKLAAQAAALQFGVGKTYTPEDIAEALKLVPQVRDWAKNVESFAYQQANNGVKIPGFKLVQKRDGNRTWADPQAAENFLIVALSKSEKEIRELYEPEKLKSPAQLDEVFGKEVINPLCKRETGGTVLVEDSDKREAVVVDKLASFQHLLKTT